MDSTVIRYGSWSISLPAFSRASRYFSDTIGIPIFTACRVPRPVAHIKHSRLQITPRRSSLSRGAGKQAGAKHAQACCSIHCGVAATHSGDLTNALGVSFDGLVVRYQLPRYPARQRQPCSPALRARERTAREVLYFGLSLDTNARSQDSCGRARRPGRLLCAPRRSGPAGQSSRSRSRQHLRERETCCAPVTCAYTNLRHTQSGHHRP